MAAIFPEHIIQKRLEALFQYVKTDLENNAGDESLSWLYDIFGGVSFENVDYFEQAKSFVNSYLDMGDKHRLRIKLGYSYNANEDTTISIVLPDEQQSMFTVSMSETSEVLPNDAGNALRNQMTFNTEFILICSAKTMDKTIILHKLLQALLIGSIEQFELSGLQNVRTSSRDLRPEMEAMPPERFHRGLSMRFFYCYEIRTLIKTSNVTDFDSSGVFFER